MHFEPHNRPYRWVWLKKLIAEAIILFVWYAIINKGLSFIGVKGDQAGSANITVQAEDSGIQIATADEMQEPSGFEDIDLCEIQNED